MDITTLFKSRLEIVRNRDKALGDTVDKASNTSIHGSPPAGLAASAPGGPGGLKSKIFPGKKSEYFLKARELCTTITNLRNFLQENRPSYLNIISRNFNDDYSSPFSSSRMSNSSLELETTKCKSLTDYERDQIDSNVQKIIQNCQKRIFEFEKYVDTSETVRNNPQLANHLNNVILSLTTYLKDVCTVYSEMRAIRVKRTLDLQSLSRLELSKSSFKPADSGTGSDFISSNSLKNKGDSTSATIKVKEKNSSTYTSTNNNFEDQEADKVTPYLYEGEEISPEEMQMLEEENAHLLRQLNTVADEVDQIHSSVIQIAQLQEIFTEKVLHQEKEVDKIANLVVGATENIKGGNEQIREAIQKNADFRAWVLFFILIMSFSLLFLDWYND